MPSRTPRPRCDMCGKRRAGSSSIGRNGYRCRECRRVAPMRGVDGGGKRRPSRSHLLTCERCETQVYTDRASRRFCSVRCAKGPAQPRAPYFVNRRAREVAAPGLNDYRRGKLLRRWRRQGGSCAYCDRPATTVDHVVPLVLGGTNFEGNLAPACRSCNGSKAGQLLIVWLMSRRSRVAA